MFNIIIIFTYFFAEAASLSPNKMRPKQKKNVSDMNFYRKAYLELDKLSPGDIFVSKSSFRKRVTFARTNKCLHATSILIFMTRGT